MAAVDDRGCVNDEDSNHDPYTLDTFLTDKLHYSLYMPRRSADTQEIDPNIPPPLSGLTHLREAERIAMRTNSQSYTVDAPQANETSTIPATMSLGRTFIVFSMQLIAAM